MRRIAIAMAAVLAMTNSLGAGSTLRTLYAPLFCAIVCRCAAGLSQCSGQCVSTATDANNCGGCGRQCSGNYPICAAGQCCPLNQPNACNGQCTNVTIDTNNCGQCGNFCENGFSCEGGGCTCSGHSIVCNNYC